MPWDLRTLAPLGVPEKDVYPVREICGLRTKRRFYVEPSHVELIAEFLNQVINRPCSALLSVAQTIARDCNNSAKYEQEK